MSVSLSLSHHQREISCSIAEQFPVSHARFAFVPSGVAGLLLVVYVRIIAQAFTCKLPIAYCTCNSFSAAKEIDR